MVGSQLGLRHGLGSSSWTASGVAEPSFNFGRGGASFAAAGEAFLLFVFIEDLEEGFGAV